MCNKCMAPAILDWDQRHLVAIALQHSVLPSPSPDVQHFLSKQPDLKRSQHTDLNQVNQTPRAVICTSYMSILWSRLSCQTLETSSRLNTDPKHSRLDGESSTASSVCKEQSLLEPPDVGGEHKIKHRPEAFATSRLNLTVGSMLLRLRTPDAAMV